MNLAEILFKNNQSERYRKLQEESFLQGFWVWNIGTIPEQIDTCNQILSAQHITHQFMYLVKTNAVKQHQVGFYADKLHISQRYLNKVIAKHAQGSTPKQIIDNQLLTEVKNKLSNPALSVSQVSQLCNFPDQPSLSRFFKRTTGISPQQYRESRAK